MEVQHSGSRQPVILLIENDEGDVFLFRRALAKSGYTGDLRVVGTATEARAYMENTHPFKDPLYYRQPSLIVSDFRLVGHTALEFLTWLRLQPAIADIPVAMLSGVTSGARSKTARASCTQGHDPQDRRCGCAGGEFGAAVAAAGGVGLEWQVEAIRSTVSVANISFRNDGEFTPVFGEIVHQFQQSNEGGWLGEKSVCSQPISVRHVRRLLG